MRTVERIAAWASIIALIMPVLGVLIPGWDASLPYFSLVALIALVTLPSLITVAWRRVNKSQAQTFRPTTILILAAPKSRGAEKAQEIVKVANDNLHYSYLDASLHVLGELPAGGQAQAGMDDSLLAKLGVADAVVVMTDIPWKSYSPAHRVFIDWCSRHRARPVIGYVPDGQTPKDFEFPIPSKGGPEGALAFLAHALLAQAIVRGKLLYGWFKLLRMAAIGLAVAITAAVVTAVALYQDARLYRRALETPAAAQEDIVSVLARFRSHLPGSAADPEAMRRAKVDMLTSIAKATVEQTSEVSAVSTTDVRRLIFYGQRNDNGKARLCQVASSNVAGECLEAGTESIVGCSFSKRLAVVWHGFKDKTSMIRAWRLDGTEIGGFDPKRRLLDLPDNSSCRYQVMKADDPPKRALLCMPLGISDTSVNLAPTGVVCLSINENESFIDEPWLRALLLRTGYALSGMTFDDLFDTAPSARPAPPQLR